MDPHRWTIRITATVRARTEPVIDWFQQPGRKAAAIAEWERQGRTECSIEDCVSGSVRIRDIRWKGRTGSTMHQRIESELGPDGRPGAWTGDRFVIVSHEVNRVRFSTGREEAVDCNNTLEFVPIRDEQTQIITTHRHRTIGCHWYHRMLPPNRARAQMTRELRQMAMRCERDLLGASSE